MKTFPIMLNIRGRRAVVVGAGPVGLRKARALVSAGARVVLVDANPGPEAQSFAGATLVREPYRLEQLADAILVFACTNDPALNRRIAADARTLGALANAADQPDDCDFFLPSALVDGDVVVAVGTGGLAPALAASVRDRIGRSLPAGLGRFAQTVGELRDTLRQRVPDAQLRTAILRRLCTQEVLEAFLAHGRSALEQKLVELLKEE